MKKEIDVLNCPVLWDESFMPDNLKNNWKVYGGEWWIENGWLAGKNPDNCPRMVVCKNEFPVNILLDFEA